MVVNSGKAYLGDSVKMTAYFKVLDEVPNDYMVFVHIEDVDGRVERLNADHSPVGGQRPTR